MSIQQKVYDTIAEPPEGYRLGAWVNFGILFLIAFNVIVGIFETVESLHKNYEAFFYYVEFFSVIIFSIEYVLKLWSCTVSERYQGSIKGRIRFMLDPMSIIDLLAILPFYLSALIVLDLRFVRILRLFRLFRLFRSGKLAKSFTTLINVIHSKKEELSISILILLLVLVFSSSVMYLVEHHVENTQFTSVPAAMWWGMMTITTIGYGDMYPVTTLGKVIGSFVGFLGICVFALPVGILGAGFSEYMEKKDQNIDDNQAPDDQSIDQPTTENHVTSQGVPHQHSSAHQSIEQDTHHTSQTCPQCGYTLPPTTDTQS